MQFVYTERKQNAPLPEFNAYLETFDYLPIPQSQNSSRQHEMT